MDEKLESEPEINFKDRFRKCLQGAFPAVMAAIKDEDTGEVILGGDHYDCYVHGYRLMTGDRRGDGFIINEVDAFDKYIRDHRFIMGFVDTLGHFISRALATQMVRHGPDVTELHAWDILA